MTLFFAAVMAFGALVLLRSALLPRRMGDWNVFTRAAWAVRAEADIYDVTDDNGFHYLYPPLFAILLTPLADAPAGIARDGFLPYPLTVLCWYALNVGFVASGVQLLASSLEQRSKNPAARRPNTRRWWRLRLTPVLFCLPAIGHTMMRGQVGLLLMFLLCGMLAALLRGRNWQAGWWLAGAICLKIIPAFLLIFPLWRRDLRCLAGCFVGLTLGLAVIPVAVRGSQQTYRDYHKWCEQMLLPGLGLGSARKLAGEVIDVTATDSQSLLSAIHNTIHLDRADRPRQAAPWVRGLALGIAAAMTLLTIAAMRRCPADDGVASVLATGALVVVMLLASPVCHLHYFCLLTPLAMGLFACSWENCENSQISFGMTALWAFNVLGETCPHFPGLEVLRDAGLAMYPALALWLSACILLWRRRRIQPGEASNAPLLSGAHGE